MAVVRGGSLLVEEAAVGVIDGSNLSFTTTLPFIPDTLQVYINGIKQAVDSYTETGTNSFDLSEAPIAGTNPDIVEIIYQRA